jgi:hypothetical protein
MARCWWASGHSVSCWCVWVLTRAADVLAIPNIPPRPRQRPELDRLQDMPEDLQPGAAHRVRRRGAATEREDQGEHITRHCTLELGTREYSGTLPTCSCRATGDCAGAKTQASGGHHLRQCADGKGRKE